MEESYYLGADLHRDSFTVFRTDNKWREILKGKYPNNHQSIDLVLSHFPLKPAVVVEATRN